MDPKEGKLDRLRQALYSRSGQKLVLKKHETPVTHDPNLKKKWEGDVPDADQIELAQSMMPHKKKTWAVRFFVGALIFFILAVSVAAYIFIRGKNFVSVENVNITVYGPAAVHGGDEVTLGIEVINNNATTLENVDLFIDFPTGIVYSDKPDQEFTRYNELVGTLAAGERKRKQLSFIVLGQAGEVKNFEIRAEYRPSGSNAIFPKRKTYTINLQSAPLAVTVKAPSEISANQSFQTTVTVTSNETKTLKNVAITLDYPQGFAYKDASPKPSVSDRVWRLGDLPPGATKTITVTGAISAQVNDERIINVSVGLLNDRTRDTITVPFSLIKHPIVVRRPFMNITVAANGDQGEGVAVIERGRPVSVDIGWQNALSTSIIDAEIRVVLKGNAYDPRDVRVERGFYNAEINTVVFDGRSVPDLRAVGPGESGRLNFELTPKVSVAPNGSFTPNPQVDMEVSVSGKRVGETQVSEDLVAVVKKSVRMATEFELEGIVSRENNPFSQKGNIPPKAGLETSYTLAFRINNTTNGLRNVQLRTTLPTYVKWAGKIAPESDRIEYNAVSGEVLWNVGNVPANSGSGLPPRDAAFQIILTPGMNHVGEVLKLTDDVTLIATDEFTGQTQTISIDPLSTRFEGYRGGEDVVRP